MEFLVAIGVGIVSKLGEVLVDPITSQFKLMIHYDKNINKMKNELNNLEDRKRVIEGTVDADRRNGRHITPNVEHWLYQVDNIIENESWKVYDDELVNNNKNCLGGLCPNLVFRYSLSKKARKMTRDLVSLKEQKLEFISYPTPLPTLGSTFTKGIKSFASRESIMEEVIERLKGDEFHRISICGMGGVGKTTLVKELIKVLEADKVFDEISMAIVSQVPDYRKIQGQIGDTLGLKFDKETLQGRACQLLERLNKINKVFLVLDDVWTELDFELIGLPSNEQSHKGCKILFTSRNEDVCHRMRSQRNFTIPILSKEEAWDLFRYTAGDHVVDKAEMHNISKQVANECRGLPIAIVTIGKALGNKDKHVWEDALDQLRRSSLISFSEMQEYSIYSCIELSYNFLGNEEAKFLLLLCSLFPEDFDIPIEVLLRYGVGLGLFKDLGALFKARNRVHTLIDTLKKRFLLLDSNKEECVKMHDVVRDTVIIIASREEHGFAVKYDVGQEGLNDEFIWHHNAISLLLDEIKMHHKSLQCPNLRLLQVFIKRRESISENFFHNMSKLMVLGLSNLCIPSMSSLFQTLNNLCTLRLEDCQVGDISIICKELRKLEVLSFAYSNIKELPVEIGKLSLLRLLDLTECNNLDQISSGVLASLSYLEELYLRVWNSHWEGKNSILAELESLSHQLKVFEISITGIHIFPKDLEFKKLIKFWIYVRDSTTLYHGLVRRGYLYPNILKLNSVYYKDIKENVAIQQLLKKSEILNLVNVKQLENVLYELDEEGFPCLKNLSIEFCNDLKYLIDESVYASSCAFRLVQSLSLNNLDNLREVCHAKSFTSSSCQCFGSLRDLKVEFCNKLKYVFSPSLSLSIGLLQRLHVTECYEVKYIVSKEIHVENLVIKFTNLVELKLEELPSFVGFTISDHKNELHLLNSQVQEEQKLNDDLHQAGSNSTLGIDRSVHIGNTLFESKWMAQFPKLKKIILLECSLLDTIFDLQRLQIEGQSIPMLFSQLKEIEISWLSKLRQIWSNVPSDIQGFQNLRSIKVKKCDSLRSIFTPTIARTLTQLQKLVIQSCQLMEKVIEDDREEQEKVETLLFTKLDSLTLKDLPSLMSICSVCYELTWPSLRYLCIDGCPQLKISSIPIQTLTKQENLKNSFSDSTLQAIGFSTTKFLPYCLGCTRSNIEISNSIGKSNFQRVGKINKKASLMRDHISSDVKKVYSREEMRSYMPNLEQLQVKGWNSLDVIFQLEKNQHSNTSINCVVKLVPMLTSPTSITGFNNLILLSLEACPNLRYLFSHSTAKLLRNLQEVKLSNCRMVEQLVKSEDGSVMFSHASSLKAVEDALPSYATSISKESFVLEFPSLKRISIINCIMLKVIIKDGEWRTDMTSFNQVQSLTLSHLPNLVSFCYQPCIPEQPSLEKCKANNHYQQVQVTYDEKRMIRNDPSINYLWFSHLTYLGIKECQKINCLFSPSSSASLVCLQELEICNCENIKEIVSKQEIHEGFFKIMFPRLQRLKLEHLSNLEAFCHSSYDLDFPLLQEVCFGNCHRMEIFSNGFATTPKLNGITMKVGKLTNIIWMGDLNTTAQLSKGLLAFQTSERLEWLKQEQGMLSYFMKEIEMNVESFQSLLALVPSNVIHLFQNLKNLTIKDCGSLIEVFESEGVNKNKRQSMIHYELEVMNLHFLPKLIHIWKNHGGVLDFQKLRILKVEYCGNLKGILSPSMAKSLVQLQHFRVCNCQMIEEIVIKEAEENERESKAEILFPLLNKLELRYLPNLKSYCAESIDIELPFCEEMIIEKCPKMMTFSYGAVSTPKLPNIYKGSYEYVDIMGDLNMTIYQAHSEDLKVALQRSETINWIEQDKILLGYITRITELVFEGCEKLLNCVPSNMIHRLQHLKQLKVRECCSLVEIFESEGVEANEDEKYVVTLHEYNLQEMHLYSLPKIMHIWKNHGEVLSFRNLKKLNMGCCDGLRSVVPFSIAKTLLQLQELSIYECEMIEVIVTKEEEELGPEESNKAKKIVFPELRWLTLCCLPNLECFCSSNYKFEMPSCQDITIKECSKMETCCYGTVRALDMSFSSVKIDHLES